MHYLKFSNLFIFHNWHLKAIKKIEDYANTKDWAIIKYKTICILSYIGSAKSKLIILLDQDNGISTD